MKALTFHGKQTIHFESVPDPAVLAPTDAIVKVELCAICGSDMHPYHEREKGLAHGTIMGHEFVGEIVETGTDVAQFKAGMRVMSPFTTNCGACFYCRLGLTCRCQSGQLFGWRTQGGQGLHGGQAEFVRVPLADATLVELPDGVSDEEGILLGDILSTGYFCAEMAGVKPAGVYVILGCGPVGLMTILAARELGAEQIYAIDTIPERLQLARKFGATTIDFKTDDSLAVLKEATDGRGADAVMEVVGSAAAGRMAVDLVGPGGTIATVGVHTEEKMAFSPVEAYNKNLTYRIGRCPARHYMPKLIPVVQRKKYDFTAIISHRLPLSAGVEGYRIFDEKREGCTKVVLRP